MGEERGIRMDWGCQEARKWEKRHHEGAWDAPNDCQSGSEWMLVMMEGEGGEAEFSGLISEERRWMV